MIIAPSIDGRLFALNALTGKPVWETRMVYPQDLYTLTMAPRIAGGKVIIGASGGDKPTRGQFVAVDAQTGQARVALLHGARRSLEAVRERGDARRGEDLGRRLLEERRRRRRVGRLRLRSRGQSGLRRHRQRRAVGAEVPRRRQGLDNLYTCSILAVDLTTGQLKWHYQTVPNDNWDFDNVQQLMLLDLNINGRPRKVITQASKNGFFYVLDRVTGEFISGEPFVKVSWALGMEQSGRPIVNPAAYYDHDPISIFPTGGGAHNWSPMSYNPTTGLVYIPASYSTFPMQAQAEYRPAPPATCVRRGDTRLIEPTHRARAAGRRARAACRPGIR